MRTGLVFMVGAAFGFLIAVFLRLPLLRPLEQNAAEVAAALGSTVLAVAGAFWLWQHQTIKRQRELIPITMRIFSPLHLALSQIRHLIDHSSATRMLMIKDKIVESPPDEEVWAYQAERLPRAIDAAEVEARTALEHWASMNELILGVEANKVPDVLELHRIAFAAINRLPELKKQAIPKYIDHQPPGIDPLDLSLLSYGIGRMARSLNVLDGGCRDTSGFDNIESPREQMIEHISKPVH
ncbi:hypothetical protein [Lysobacter sp. CFH 32150]|uniref:hypothetical protein n=1 Tax=Lysobacter sp. CFH 32150 TaxID=2927128 RepID=UPI001FA784B0|nr:hypothetical protein [Lysobacter sp. CFH 32150]MCI4568524.1 hypothetical protein [Lysobacter sp. CFH 32150]